MSVRDREDAVVARLQQLAPHLDGEPDPAFRAATRARLVAMAAVRTPAPEPATGLKRLLSFRAEDAAPTRWRARLTAGLAGAAMAVTAMATLVAVSTDAQPGDALYGLKRGTEQTQLALAGDARGQTLLDFASTRLDEIERLVDDGPSALPAVAPSPSGGMTVMAAAADAELVVDTLTTMDAQTTEGAEWLADRAVDTGNPGPLEDLSVWAAGQAAQLADLQSRMPEAARPAAETSLALLGGIDTRADGLQAALDCVYGPAVRGADALGPLPTLCLPPEAATPGAGGSTDPGGSAATGVPTTPPDRGTGSTAVPPTTTDGVPLPGGVPGTGGGNQGGGGSGGGSGGSVDVPGGPPSVEIPTTIPSLPSVTLPGRTQLPGTGAAEESPSVPVVPLPSLCVPVPVLGLDC